MNGGCSLSIYIQTNINMGSTHVVDVLILLIPILFSFPGELIGIDYLYMQTGKCMQDMDPEGEETEQLLEDLADEGFTDDTEASLEVFSALISLPSAQPPTSGSWSAAPPPPSPPPPPPASAAVTAPGATPQVPVEQLVISTFEK